MNYVPLYISSLNKVDVLKSPGRFDVILVAISYAIGYSKVRDNYSILISVKRVLMYNCALSHKPRKISF